MSLLSWLKNIAITALVLSCFSIKHDVT